MICRNRTAFCPFSLALLGAGWFLVALFVGETELLSRLPGPAPQLTLFGLTFGLLSAFWLSRSFRASIDHLSLRALIGLHLVRFVGIYFLVLQNRGELPRLFATTAGWGDIVVALGALGLIIAPALQNSSRAVFIWNMLGLIDILVVVATAAGIAYADRPAMSALTRLPLSFLPTLVVPLIITSHVVVFVRLLKRRQPQKLEAPGQALATL